MVNSCNIEQKLFCLKVSRTDTNTLVSLYIHSDKRTSKLIVNLYSYIFIKLNDVTF